MLGHRRLKVVDLSEAAAQPMVTGDGRFAIVYNGELYNDAEVRAELERDAGAARLRGGGGGDGRLFRTVSDTETVLLALAAWGPAGLGRLRGMYALGFVDLHAGTVLLARDPLGIKPLYWAMPEAPGGRELAFASEVRAILNHPAVPARPDAVAVSAYLTTIRTVMGERTLFQGIKAVRPGQALVFDLNGEQIEGGEVVGGAARTPRGSVREVVADSVRRHLRSDVPVCCLLSGGLDSSVVATVAKGELGRLYTYCSGAASGEKDDLWYAREVAATLGTSHTEAPVDRELFRGRWPEMVRAMGVPLSTPNEVAINEVSRRLRADGKIVALSGEGADELFAGYPAPLMDAARFEGLLGQEAPRSAGPDLGGAKQHPGEFQLAAAAWVPLASKGVVLQPHVWRGLEMDAALRAFYRTEFEAVTPLGAAPVASTSADPEFDGTGSRPDLERLQAHARFHRRINLSGLLQRLDTATMLEGVEGRTPLADIEVGALAESLPMSRKARLERGPGGEGKWEVRTKIALREAFADDLPAEIVARPKASFLLPFQDWLVDQVGVLRTSSFARQVFTAAAIEAVAEDPKRAWPMAWPMMNLAMWGEAFWGG